MLPWIEVSQKLSFTCELLLPNSISADNLKKWLSAGGAIEISFSEVLENSEKFWVVRFCTEDEVLVKKLQARCRELALDNLKQRDEKATQLTQKLRALNKQAQTLQSAESSQAKYIESLQDELQKLRWEVSKLQEIENQYKSLGRTYRIQSEKLSLLEKQVSHSEGLNTQPQAVKTAEKIAPRIPVDVCIVCGKAAMPAQGICLDCSR